MYVMGNIYIYIYVHIHKHKWSGVCGVGRLWQGSEASPSAPDSSRSTGYNERNSCAKRVGNSEGTKSPLADLTPNSCGSWGSLGMITTKSSMRALVGVLKFRTKVPVCAKWRSAIYQMGLQWQIACAKGMPDFNGKWVMRAHTYIYICV